MGDAIKREAATLAGPATKVTLPATLRPANDATTCFCSATRERSVVVAVPDGSVMTLVVPKASSWPEALNATA